MNPGTAPAAGTEKEIALLVERQREYFRSGATLPVPWRIRQLKKLRQAVRENEAILREALAADLNRSDVEAYLSDIGPAIAEINETIRGLRRWARSELRLSGLMCFPSLFTRVYKLPYGVTLLISPFNFPILLTLGVLTAAIAGGNTAVIRASGKSPACTAALKRLLGGIFPEEYVTVVEGGHDVADLLLAQRFDKIFYTGSPAVGRHVAEAAAKHLTPVALELGGENGNWCIVRRDADLRDAARKIAFFKLMNAGQICIEINQVAVAEEVAAEFVTLLREELIRQIGEHAERSAEYPSLITEAAYDRCADTVERYRDRVVFGGVGDRAARRYAPTVIYPVSPEEDLVRHELFAPILPVVPFRDHEVGMLLDTIARREHPLAMYLFTSDLRWARRVMASQQYGGGCINEVCLHMMVKGVPFGGTGHSGMGAYHGVWGFREFTHPSAVLTGSRHFNLSLREHPYTGKKGERKLKLLRIIEK